MERHWVVDAATAAVTRYGARLQGYSDAEYRELLANCGFGEIVAYPSLHGEADPGQANLIAMVARKQPADHSVI